MRGKWCTVFKTVDGNDLTADEGLQRKYSIFSQSMEEQRQHAIATGGMDRDIGADI